jgi:hypothetical protein
MTNSNFTKNLIIEMFNQKHTDWGAQGMSVSG